MYINQFGSVGLCGVSASNLPELIYSNGRLIDGQVRGKPLKRLNPDERLILIMKYVVRVRL